MPRLMRAMNLARLNSLTRYEDIPTYHTRDPDTGVLENQPCRTTGEIIATEKIDGVLARIVLLADGYLIGNDRDWLHAQGDLVANPSQGIVKLLRPLADAISPPEPDAVVILYGEVFGGKVSAASEQYTSKKEFGFRLFDVARLSSAALELPEDTGGLSFLREEELQNYANQHGLKLAPRVARFPAPDLPKSIDATRTLLEELLPTSRCRLDADAGGEPEGLVLRKVDRSWIVTLRVSDYRRAKRKQR
jgi:RNA ligase